MRRFLEQLLEQIPADGRLDFVDAFAKPYPSLVIAEVMGAPLTDAPRLHHWSNWIQRQFDAASLMTERELIEEAVAEFYAYEDELIAARRPAPGDDLISSLIEAEDEGDHQVGEAGRDRLTDDELRNLILNILVGGVDTSQSQLAHAVRLLALHPDQWERLREDPRGLALAAVDEALRYEPITPFTARITVDEVEYRGVTFPPNSIVLVSAWHANRDGIEPDAFDIVADRPRARVLTFGAGIHYCVGANLARAEMEEAVAFLGERVRSVSLDGEPVFGSASGIYGLDALPVRVELA
jgi:cytochrome P450